MEIIATLFVRHGQASAWSENTRVCNRHNGEVSEAHSTTSKDNGVLSGGDDGG